MSKIIFRIIVMLLVLITFISASYNTIYAAYNFTESYITKIGEANYHLKYYKEKEQIYSYTICSIVGHYQNGKFYPAYCLNKDFPGVEKLGDYAVDIDNIMQDDRVWRIVKNGYPNKTGSELGLESDFDAFAVTKFAIYCVIGQSDINLFTADEDDKEGQAMLMALRNLVNIGLYGDEKYSSSIEITKDGDFVEEGEYYSQSYKVKSSVTTDNYKITNLSGMPEGALLTDINGNIKTEFYSGEKFKIKIPKSKLNSDLNINIDLEANLKTYPIFYGKTRISETQNYLVTADAFEKVTTSTNLNIKLNTGKVKIYKIDEDTQLPIEGVEFTLRTEAGDVLQTATTNSEGVAEFYGLYQGKYIINETKSNENYLVEDKDFNIDVSYNKTSEIKIENEHKKGSLSIKKVDKDNNNILLGNVEFDLYSEELGKVVGTYFTDANGELNIQDLRTGSYSLIEKSTNKWYNLSENEKIDIIWNETTQKTIENELKKGQIQIIKVDKENHEIKIPNVEFEVLDSNMNVLEKIKTDNEGVALTSKYPIRDYDSLFIKEIKTDEKYVLNDELLKIELKENEITNLTIENQKIKGTIKVVKTSSEDSKITGIKKDEPLSGVEFKIYNSSDELVDTIITNKDGIATTKDLEKGIYKVKEQKTNEWYILDEKTYNIEISQNGKEEILNLKNTPENPDVDIEKVGPEKTSPDEEIVYEINVENTGNVALDEFIWEDMIPYNYINVTNFKTGTYNQEGTFDVYYKTNYSDEYILLLEDLSTKENTEIDFAKELADNEYVTSIKLDFGTVQKGFKSEEKTEIKAKVKHDVKSKDIFENTVTIEGIDKGYKVQDESKWKTEVLKTLPVTGF